MNERQSYNAQVIAEFRLLNSKIMLKHYSPALLYSDEARARFVEPDLLPIPRYRN